MSITALSDDHKAAFLLAATMKKIEANLLELAMDAIRPKILENIRETLTELEPIIRAHNEQLTGNMIMQLIVREPRA